MTAECTVACTPTTAAATTNAATTAVEATREEGRYVTPPVDIYETAEGLTVVADVPGLAQDQLDLSVDNRVLTIKGRVWAEPVATDGNHRTAVLRPVLREFEPTGYFRQFTLGEKIDPTRIGAELRHGVLTLRLPFAEKAKPQQITVKVA